MDGLLLIDKPAGITSHDVVLRLRKLLGEKRIGHCGTLDPFATGLLLITLGQATKISAYLEHQTKTYTAIIKLGEATDSADLTGKIIETSPVPPSFELQLPLVEKQFLGTQKQIPPMHSAIKIQGQKLYHLAHQDKVIERPAREITIHELALQKVDMNQLQMTVTCSSGTYVRTLGESIAKALETVGHLVQLKRIQSGSFAINQAYSLSSITKDISPLSIDKALAHIRHVTVAATDVSKIYNGKPIIGNFQDPLILIISEMGQALALYSRENGTDEYRCQRGLWG